MRPRVGSLVAALVLFLPALVAAADSDRSARPDSGGGTTRTVPVVQSAPDTSMLTGNGLNTTSGPIDRPVAGGVMRKDPGSRTWYFVKALSDAELKLEYERHLEELIQKYGSEPRDIVIEVKDTTDVRRLRGFSISLTDAPPCTVSVRVLYKQLPELKKAGLLFWGKGDRRPTPGADKRLRLPPKAPMPGPAPLPGGQGRKPAPSPSSLEGVLSPQTTVFSDGFEGAPLPNANWNVGDLNPNSGLDHWLDLDFSCGYVRTGSWSAACAGYSDTPCFAYDNNQDAYLQNPYYFDMSSYSSYTASFWFWLSSEYNYDFFRVYFNTGAGWIPWYAASGSSGGWIQRTLTLPNSGHLYDSFAFLFKFESDYTNAIGAGAYVDDVLLDGTISQPNLTYYTPPGWSYPVVPSSITGTNIVGTLYSGQPTYIDWAIQNNGSGGTSTIFYVDYYLDGTWIGSGTVFGLNAGSADTREDWSYTVGSPGWHTLKMVIDPTGAVGESNESDNVYERSFYWNAPPPPDLVVQSVVPSTTNPVVGQIINVTVTIKNQGAGPANVSFLNYSYKNLGAPPIQGQLPYDDSHATFTLAAGATDTYTIYNLTSQYAVPWTMYVYADAVNDITTESNESNNASSGVVVNWAAGSVTVSGTLAYDDTSYTTVPRVNNRPMRCVKIELWDSDAGQGSADDFLVTASTNAAGQFSFPAVVNQDTDADQGRLDVYVKAFFQTDAACLGNPGIKVIDLTLNPWTFQTTPVPDVANGPMALGTLKPLDYGRRSALHIYDTMLRGYDWAVAWGVGPLHPWFLKALWQPGANNGSFYVWQDTTLTVMGVTSTVAEDRAPDEWDTGPLLHEYGHHLAHLFGFNDPTAGGPHSPQNELTPQLAWSEGVAQYLSCITQSPPPDTKMDWGVNATWTQTHLYTMNFETCRLTLDGNDLGQYNNQGWKWELPVGGTLWDVYDANIDDQTSDTCGGIDSLADGSTRIWNVLAVHPGMTLYTMYDFYNLFCQRYATGDPTLARLLSKVFCEHGMVTSGCGIVAVEGGRQGVSLSLRCEPNPMNRSGTIAFGLPDDPGNMPVRLALYDVSGRAVKTLIDEKMPSGRHAVTWDGTTDDGRRVAAGVYFCRLATASGSKTSSLLVVR